MPPTTIRRRLRSASPPIMKNRLRSASPPAAAAHASAKTATGQTTKKNRSVVARRSASSTATTGSSAPAATKSAAAASHNKTRGGGAGRGSAGRGGRGGAGRGRGCRSSRSLSPPPPTSRQVDVRKRRAASTDDDGCNDDDDDDERVASSHRKSPTRSSAGANASEKEAGGAGSRRRGPPAGRKRSASPLPPSDKRKGRREKEETKTAPTARRSYGSRGSSSSSSTAAAASPSKQKRSSARTDEVESDSKKPMPAKCAAKSERKDGRKIIQVSPEPKKKVDKKIPGAGATKGKKLEKNPPRRRASFDKKEEKTSKKRPRQRLSNDKVPPGEGPFKSAEGEGDVGCSDAPKVDSKIAIKCPAEPPYPAGWYAATVLKVTWHDETKSDNKDSDKPKRSKGCSPPRSPTSYTAQVEWDGGGVDDILNPEWRILGEEPDKQGRCSRRDAKLRPHLKHWVKRLRYLDMVEETAAKSRVRMQNDAPVEWIMCANPSCGKWRALPRFVDSRDVLRSCNNTWYCVLNSWDESIASCNAPQETGFIQDNTAAPVDRYQKRF